MVVSDNGTTSNLYPCNLLISFLYFYRAHKGNGEFREALKYALQALKIYSMDEKAHLYVHKLKQKLQQQQQQQQ
jgi:hypothetical protein